MTLRPGHIATEVSEYKMSIPLLVESREPPIIADQLSRLGLGVGIGRFDAGDIQFWPHGMTAGIERSTISDLLGKLASGRIIAQAHKMVAAYQIPIFMREGPFRKGRSQHLEYHDPRHPDADGEGWVRTGWAWSSFQGMMFDLRLLGLLFWDCYDLGAAAYDIAMIVESLSQEDHRWLRTRTRPPVLTADKPYRNVVWSLSAFEGIGPETASELLQGHTFAEVIRAADEEPTALLTTKGFGKKRADSLHAEVTRRYG